MILAGAADQPSIPRASTDEALRSLQCCHSLAARHSRPRFATRAATRRVPLHLSLHGTVASLLLVPTCQTLLDPLPCSCALLPRPSAAGHCFPPRRNGTSLPAPVLATLACHAPFAPLLPRLAHPRVSLVPPLPFFYDLYCFTCVAAWGTADAALSAATIPGGPVPCCPLAYGLSILALWDNPVTPPLHSPPPPTPSFH